MCTADKDSIRKAAKQARRDQGDKQTLSRRITQRLEAMPQYIAAQRVLWYLDVRDEVRTRQALPAAISSGKTIVIPYCVGDDLQLFHLQQSEDLAPGAFGILEPRIELRTEAVRTVAPANLDFIAVPGVAFDARGGRLGHGRGFYDRLLARVHPATVLVGLAFECQIVPRIPMADHDIAMDWLVTERRTICCAGDPRVRAGDEHW